MVFEKNTLWNKFFMVPSVSIIIFAMFNCICTPAQGNNLEWSISSEKEAFYPGEPILLILHIYNKGTRSEKVDFGMDGIEAFSIKIVNSEGAIVRQGGKILRWGFARGGTVSVSPGQVSQKRIVVNQWCSTLLPVGKYRIACDVEYWLRSESKRQEGREVFKAGPLHQTMLERDVQIIEMDEAKFGEILKTLSNFETQKETQTKAEWIAEREISREMIAFAESELAVSCQLHLLTVDQSTWRKQDTINSLVRSGTAQAAGGLAQMYEGDSAHYEDVKNDIIDAVFQLRETEKPDILTATEEFVIKHKRPLTQPLD